MTAPRPELSVVVCTHNPSPERLGRVFNALRLQEDIAVGRWELVVVDSASNPAVVADLSWHPAARVVREAEPGLTRARLRGIAETRGDVVVFVDDDNLLASNYLAQVSDIAAGWPHIGAWSGSAFPEFEGPPPAWSTPYLGILALREVKCDMWSNLPDAGETMPTGAGMCVRRNVAVRYAEMHLDGRRSVHLDRVGESLLSGGDNDLALCACDMGLGMGVFRALSLIHLIPAGRTTEAYLLRLTESIAFSSVLLHAQRGAPDAGMLTPRSRAANAVRALLMRSRPRRFFRAGLRGRRRALNWLAHPTRDNPPPTL